MDPDDRRWSGSSAGSSVFLSESRDRLSSMQALSGSGGNVSLATASPAGADSIRYGESSGAPSLMPLSASTMASGSRRVMALRHEFARHGKARTVSETDLNYGRAGTALVGTSSSSTGSPSPSASHAGGFFRSAASVLGIGDEVGSFSMYRKQQQTQQQFRAEMMRDQFRRRKAMTVDDPAHQQLIRRSSEKVRRHESPIKQQRSSDSRSDSWRGLHQKPQSRQSPTQSSTTDMRYHGCQSHSHAQGRPYHPQQAGALSSDLWSRGDALMSRRSSPFLWLRQCIPELIVSSSYESSSGEDIM